MRRLLFSFALVLFACLPQLAGAAEKKETPKPSPTPGFFDQMRFRNVGPAVSGGRLGAVAGTDADSSLYYVGAAGGGVWRSTNAGQTFIPVFDSQTVGSIGAVAIDPQDSKIVWVGTGEGAPRNDVSPGDGVYRSADSGKTWTHVLNLGNALIANILIDPRDSNVVLVSVLGDPFADNAARGVYRTADGGKSWQKTLYVDGRTGASDMAASRGESGVVYAGMWPYRRTGWSSESGGTQGGLYKSSDFGVTWEKLTGRGLPSGETGRIGVAVAPSDPLRVYALIESRQGILWRSDDGGASWKLVSSNTLANERPFYYTHVFVDPANEDHLWALSVHLAASNDGGKTWKIGARGVHGDNHAMWISKDLNRFTWDTTEDSPPVWKFTPTWNRGAAFSQDRVPVLPGKYVLELHAGATLRGSIVVRQDPRTHYTAAQFRENYTAMSQVFGDFGRVNVALNVLSAVLNEAPLRTAALNRVQNGALALRVAAAASEAHVLLLSITQDPINDQDDDFLTDVLRERLQTQMGTFGGLNGAPTAVQLRENSELHALTNDRLRAVAAFESGVLRQVDAALRAAKIAPLTTLTQQPKIYDEAVGGRRGGDQP